jgi:hypothetical protein
MISQCEHLFVQRGPPIAENKSTTHRTGQQSCPEVVARVVRTQEGMLLATDEKLVLNLLLNPEHTSELLKSGLRT